MTSQRSATAYRWKLIPRPISDLASSSITFLKPTSSDRPDAKPNETPPPSAKAVPDSVSAPDPKLLSTSNLVCPQKNAGSMNGVMEMLPLLATRAKGTPTPTEIPRAAIWIDSPPRLASITSPLPKPADAFNPSTKDCPESPVPMGLMTSGVANRPPNMNALSQLTSASGMSQVKSA